MSLLDRFTSTEKRVTQALALHDEVTNLHSDVLDIRRERDEVVKSHNYKITILSRRQSICKSTSELTNNQFLLGRLTDRLTALEHDFEKSIINKVKETYKKRERLNKLLKDSEVNEIFKSEQEKHRIGDSYELVKKAYAENKINKDKFKTARKKAEKKLKNQVHYADAIVINKNNEILLLKRSIDEGDVFSGKWCLPGGHVDPNEPSKEAAIRELQEETLIELPEEVIVQHSTTLNKPTALIDYYTVYLSDSPVIMLNEREHADYEWVSIENLENYDVIADLGTVLSELFFMNEPTEIKKGNYGKDNFKRLFKNEEQDRIEGGRANVEETLVIGTGIETNADIYGKEEQLKAFTILQKAFESGQIDEETFEKAQKVYANNPENKRLNRVGQPWGSSGEGMPEKQPKKNKEEEDKEGSKSTEEHAQKASEKALQGATKSGDEELRLAAKKELERRDGEGKEEEYKEKLDSGEYDKDEDGVRQYKDKFKDEETQKLKDIAEATKDKDLKTALGEIIKERGEGQKEESDTDHDSKIKELEEKINELRGAEIDYSDEKALQENIDQTKQAMEERKNLVSERDSLRKVSFEEYKKGFKDFVGKSTEEVYNFYGKEATGVNKYLKENEAGEIAINTYVGKGFVAIRGYLSNPSEYSPDKFDSSMDLETVKEVSEDLSKFIQDNKIKDNVVLNRRIKGDGIKFFEALEKGEVYEDKSFSSSSLKELTHFGDFNISILAKKGSSVANIDNTGEVEYLIDKGAKFRVLEKSDKNIIVELL